MAEQVEKPKRKRGRPKQQVTKKAPLKEVKGEGPEAPHNPADEYFEIMIQHVEGESRQVGPFWGYAPTVGINEVVIEGVKYKKAITAAAPQIWIYRGERVVVPHWVVKNLEGMEVETLDCDMSVTPPRYFKIRKTRAPFDILRSGLTKEDYENFKKGLEKKRFNPWAEQHK